VVDNPRSHRPNPARDRADKVPEMSESIARIVEQLEKRSPPQGGARFSVPIVESRVVATTGFFPVPLLEGVP